MLSTDFHLAIAYIIHQESLEFFKNAELHFVKWNGVLYGPTIHNDTKKPLGWTALILKIQVFTQKIYFKYHDLHKLISALTSQNQQTKHI